MMRAARILALLLACPFIPGSTLAQSVVIGGNSSIGQCDTTTYSVSLINTSGGTIEGIQVLVDLANLPGFTFVEGSSQLAVDGVPFCSSDPVVAGSKLAWDVDSLCATSLELEPGQLLDVSFSLHTSCSAVSGTLEATTTWDGGSEVVTREVHVLPGAVAVSMTPAVADAAFGDQVTWTLTVESTGSGTVRNVVVTNVLGSGLAYVTSTPAGVNNGQSTTWSATEVPALALMDPGGKVTIEITAEVVSCTSLDATSDVRWGCSSATCFDTAVSGGTAVATVQRGARTPWLSFTPPDVTFAYCDSTAAMSFAVDNIGDGHATDPRLVVDLSPLDVSSSSFPYSAGAFSLPEMASGASETLNVSLGYSSWCSDPNIAGDLVWQGELSDQCGQLYSAPVAVSQINVPTGSPDLTTTLTGVDASVDIGAALTYTVGSVYTGATSCGSGSTGAITVVSTVPDGFTVTATGGGSWVPGGGGTGGTITWTFTPPATLSASVTLQAPDHASCETYCGLLATISVDANGVDCCGCARSADTTSANVAITCEAQGSVLKSAAPSTVTHCNQLAYATTYSFADDATVWLNEFVLREHADNEQEYVNGSLTATLSGMGDITGCAGPGLSDTTPGPGGDLTLDLSGCPAASLADQTLTIEYSLTTSATSPCADSTFDSWTTIGLPSSGSACLADGELHTATSVTVEAPTMEVAISGLDEPTEQCATETVTVTLTQTSAVADPKDVRLQLSGLDDSILNPAATVCSGVAPVSCSPTFVGDEPVWEFADTFTGNGQSATLELTVQKRCSGVQELVATAYFDDNCHDDDTSDDTCSTSSSATPAVLTGGNVHVEATPQTVVAESSTVAWRIIVTNRGAGAARNVWVDAALGSGLGFIDALVDDMSGVTVTSDQDHAGNAINGATVAISSLAAGTRRTITLQARLNSCTNLTLDATASHGCSGFDCQTSVTSSASVEAPAPQVTSSVTLSSPITSCESSTAEIVVRNVGQSSVSDIQQAVTLPAGLSYIAGSTRWRLGGGAWNGPASAYDPSPATSPLAWTSSQIPALATLEPGEQLEIDIGLVSSCTFAGGSVDAVTSFDSQCGARLSASDSSTALVRQPDIALTIVRSDDPIDCGELLVWTISVENRSPFTVPVVWVESTLGDAFIFHSSEGDWTYTGDNGTAVGQVVSWELVDLPAGTTVDLTLRADADMPPCDEDLGIAANAWWGCGTVDGSSNTRPGDPGPDSGACLTSVPVNVGRAETRRPQLGLSGITLSETPGGETMTVVVENSGPTDAFDLDLDVTLPAELSYLTGTSRLCVGVDETCVPAGAPDPVIVGRHLIFYDPASTGSNLTSLLQAAGDTDTLVLRFDLSSSCYSASDVDFELSFYDCCSTTQHQESVLQALSVASPAIDVTQSLSSGAVSCSSANQTWTVTVRNTGNEAAQVVRVEAEAGDWVAVDPAAATPPATVLPGGGFGWELNNLAKAGDAGDEVSFIVPVGLSPTDMPNQADCSIAQRELNVSSVWGAGSGGEATDGDPTTTDYDCTHAVPSTAESSVVPMPNVLVTSLTPTASCISDGVVSGGLAVHVENHGDGAASGSLTIGVSDGAGWTGTGTWSGSLAASAGADVTIDTPAWAPTCHSCSNPYSFTASADLTDEICECNESDNSFGPSPFSVPIANLQAVDHALTISCSTTGTAIVIGTVTIGNSGCGPVSGADIAARFTLTDQTGGAGNVIETWQETFTAVSLAAGASTTLPITPRSITTALCGPTGSDLLSTLVEIDSTDAVCECSGSDNDRLADNLLLSGESCEHAPWVSLAPPMTLADATSGRDDVLDWGTSCPSGPTSAASGLGPEVVYRLRVANDCSGTIAVTPATSWDTAVWWLESSSCATPPTGACVGMDAAGAGGAETLSVSLAAETDYLLVVDGSGGDAGSYAIELDLAGCVLVPVELLQVTVQ